MKTFTKKFSMLSVLAVSLFAAGCDALQEPIEPRLSPSGMIVMSTDGVPYVVAEESDPQAGSVSAVVGSAGGELKLGSHTLYISAGAVSDSTTFKMVRDPETPIRVHLTASRVTENDVGAAGFGAPVTLKLHYGSAAELPSDPASLTAMYFRPDGLVETLATTVDTEAATVTTHLPHFSLFGLGWP